LDFIAAFDIDRLGPGVERPHENLHGRGSLA
jgi:hypothetical protein